MALAHRDGRREHLPDPAAAGLRHHRRRRHGDERAGHGAGRRGRLRRRRSGWPTSPAGWKSRRSASPRSRATRSCATCCTRRSGRRARRARARSSTCAHCCAELEQRRRLGQQDRLHQRLLRRAARRARAVPAGGPAPGRPARRRPQQRCRACRHSRARPGRSNPVEARALVLAGLAGRRLRHGLRRADAAGADRGRSGPTCWSRGPTTARTRSSGRSSSRPTAAGSTWRRCATGISTTKPDRQRMRGGAEP